MKTLKSILSIAAVLLLVYALVKYAPVLIIFIVGISLIILACVLLALLIWMHDNNELKEWRNEIHKGQRVMIRNGKHTFEAKIMHVSDSGFVKVMDENGNLGGYSINSAYPLNWENE